MSSRLNVFTKILENQAQTNMIAPITVFAVVDSPFDGSGPLNFPVPGLKSSLAQFILREHIIAADVTLNGSMFFEEYYTLQGSKISLSFAVIEYLTH